MGNDTPQPPTPIVGIAAIGDSVNIAGTSLQGYVRTDYNTLISVFGAPTIYNEDPTDKTTREWWILFENGVTATIYDWKRYEMGAPGGTLMMDWNVGGSKREAVDLIRERLAKAYA